MNAAGAGDRFWRRLLIGILPLLVWIVQFAIVYGLAAAQCSPGGWRPGGPDPLLPGVVTVVALAVCAWLAWRVRGVPRRRDAGLLDWARLVLAVLAFVATAWTGVPLLLVAGCA